MNMFFCLLSGLFAAQQQEIDSKVTVWTVHGVLLIQEKTLENLQLVGWHPSLCHH